jgi:hypothetical protein
LRPARAESGERRVKAGGQGIFRNSVAERRGFYRDTL